MVAGSTGQSDGEYSLVARWNGHRFSRLATPRYSRGGVEIYGIDCTSSKHCVDAGGFFPSGPGYTAYMYTLTQTWDGLRWKTLRSPALRANGSEFSSIDCVSSMCMAVGSRNSNYQPKTLAERLVAGKWHLLAT